MKQKEFDMTRDPRYNLESCASATECTGLAPAAVRTPQEGDALGDLYSLFPLTPDGEVPSVEKKEE